MTEAEDGREAFVRAQTRVEAPPLVPELRLHLASEVVPLWEATEARLAEQGLPPPFWAFAWAGGQALARFLLDRPSLAEGRRVLDFAAGGGLQGLAAARSGAAAVTAAEIDPFAATAIRLNAALNGLEIGTLEDDLLSRDPTEVEAEVVLAGDVCYEAEPARRIFAWLRGHAALGRLVLMGDPGRNYLPVEGVERLAVYDVPVPVEIEDRPIRQGAAWRVLE